MSTGETEPTHRAELSPPVLAGLSAANRDRLRELTSLLRTEASAVDSADTLPPGHLDALAEAGFYGILAPVSAGGLGLGYPETCAVVEELASACVATTFVWVQHFRFLAAMLETGAPYLSQMRGAAIAGTTKGGVALTGLIPGPPRLTAERVGGAWVLRGEAPWVSGWDIVDVLLVVARGPEDTVVSLLLDARTQRGLSVTRAHLSALNATRTVRLGFERLAVPDERLVGQEAHAMALQQSGRLRLNGSFPLGVIKRCCTLLGPSPLDDSLRACREKLDSANEATMPTARATACALAVRAAHVLAVSRGSRSAIAGDVAERLSREAALLLVFASRPAIKEALLQKLERPNSTT